MKGCRAVLAALFVMAAAGLLVAEETPLETAKHAFEKGEYSKIIEILKSASAKEPGNGDIQLWLTRAYLEMERYDEAVHSGERAVAINPQSSTYHKWLGEAYGGKADHASMLSAYSLARKTQKEFQIAVQLDEKNFDAVQDLIEFDCTAPGMVGGGEDKAQVLIQKLTSMDAAEGHYGTGICRAQKKDYPAADAAFTKAIENRLKSADRIYDIGDYFVQRGQAAKLIAVADAGESLVPSDPRGKFYRALGWILKGEKPSQAETLLHEYLQVAPLRSTYPKPWQAHYWLGRLHEVQKDPGGAKEEYKAALKLNAKYKAAQDALKKLGGQ